MNVQGFLIDLDGVLYIDDRPLSGAPEVMGWLRDHNYPVRFLTNTTMKSRDQLVEKLNRFGIHAEPQEVFSTCVVAARWLAAKGISRAQLLIAESARRDFSGFEITSDQPQAVVVGDLGPDWSFDVLNEAFLAIRAGALFVALQKNRFWCTQKGPVLDAGAFVAALEYATETEATLVGKPNPAYFETALRDLGLPAGQVAMVGDDIHSDIVGAQAVGARTVLVKTGKYQLDKQKPSSIVPDWVLDSIEDLPRSMTIRADT